VVELHIAQANHPGHRGATDFIAFAALLALAARLSWSNSSPYRSGAFIGPAAFSHP
jgi:membrane-bound metal-dependent hydrolase YbcI (DUF457 family)